MNYIRITKDNIEREHICCAMSGKQSLCKKEWLKERPRTGAKGRVHSVRRGTETGIFI